MAAISPVCRTPVPSSAPLQCVSVCMQASWFAASYACAKSRPLSCGVRLPPAWRNAANEANGSNKGAVGCIVVLYSECECNVSGWMAHQRCYILRPPQGSLNSQHQPFCNFLGNCHNSRMLYMQWHGMQGIQGLGDLCINGGLSCCMLQVCGLL